MVIVKIWEIDASKHSEDTKIPCIVRYCEFTAGKHFLSHLSSLSCVLFTTPITTKIHRKLFPLSEQDSGV